MDAQGCPNTPFDSDRDGDVDQGDLNAFMSCVTGPAIAGLPAGCPTDRFNALDRDGDGDLDQGDFGIFQRCYSGANKPADPDCAN